MKPVREFREQIIETAKAHFEASIHRHRMNAELILEHSVAVAEHPDMMETLESELSKMAEYHDRLEMLETYF